MAISLWETHNIEAQVINALRAVRPVVEGHAFGPWPYVTAYQLAIAVEGARPGLAKALGKEVGGEGTGAHHSLTQYLAKQLSWRIAAGDGAYPIEGAFLSNKDVDEIVYDGPAGEVRSSLTDTPYFLSLFRLRGE